MAAEKNFVEFDLKAFAGKPLDFGAFFIGMK